MKYIELVEKEEVLKIISNFIRGRKEQCAPVPADLPEIYWEVDHLKQYSMTQTELSDYS